MTVRREIAQNAFLVKRPSTGSRDALSPSKGVSRMRRYRHTLSVLRFTLHKRRFTRKSSESAIAAEALMNNAG
jgi:hypothetical protein